MKDLRRILFVVWAEYKNFGQYSEIPGLNFSANVGLHTQPATLATCLKIIDISLLKWPGYQGICSGVKVALMT